MSVVDERFEFSCALVLLRTLSCLGFEIYPTDRGGIGVVSFGSLKNMSELLRGHVKWFNDAKGFGFIEHESGRDVFVHYSVIEAEGFKTLKDGEEVVYTLQEGEKGLHAASVNKVNDQKQKEQAPLVAPNLESGTVETTVQTTASMIEVERDGSLNKPEISIGGTTPELEVENHEE
ncbi:hypothetical protein BVY02_00180 [bacterium J17]|nr:hypothetical protein BVY02_00180 [bacterium J17]